MRHARVTWVAALLVSVTMSTTSRDAAAEREVALGASYDARVPAGSLRRLIPETSFSGFQARWDFYPLDALATGFAVQYNLFQRDTRTDTLQIPNGAVTATTFRYASLWSVLPTVRYYLFPRDALRPYAEIGVGVMAATSATLVSDISQRDLSTAFIAQPSVGVLWRLTKLRSSQEATEAAGVGRERKPMESMFGLTASASYAFTTADVTGANDIQYGGFQIGIYAKP